MKDVDPLLLIPTAVVSLGLLVVLGRFAVTGEASTELLTILSTMMGGLVTAIATRKKKGGDDDGD